MPIPPGLRPQLRPYQQTGVSWLRFVTGLGLGACLADDMGLGKTVQVIGLLLHRKSNRTGRRTDPGEAQSAGRAGLADRELEGGDRAVRAHALVPDRASFGERDRQSPGRETRRSRTRPGDHDLRHVARLQWLREHDWDLVILDEAQAIKNSGTRQTRTVKELKAAARVALTGTPVENRLSDLWSLFDFLNPGLLGGAKAFASLVKQMEARASYQPLRTLVGPYILRRLKTDKRVIADLPEKTEMSAFCR